MISGLGIVVEKPSLAWRERACGRLMLDNVTHGVEESNPEDVATTGNAIAGNHTCSL
jgi:hypothetical protein